MKVEGVPGLSSVELEVDMGDTSDLLLPAVCGRWLATSFLGIEFDFLVIKLLTACAPGLLDEDRTSRTLSIEDGDLVGDVV